jgi:hypothetical protein
MNHLKMLALAGMTAVLVLAAAGAASATEVTSPAGTKLGVKTVIKAGLSGQAIFHPPFGSITCNKASGEGEITSAGGTTETVKGILFIGNFSECNATITVLSTGTAEVHTEKSGSSNGNGTMTSSGAQVTVQFVGTHCIYGTSNTDFGNVIGGTPAIVKVNGIIPRTGGTSGIFCGSTAQLTAELVVTTPGTLFVD